MYGYSKKNPIILIKNEDAKRKTVSRTVKKKKLREGLTKYNTKSRSNSRFIVLNSSIYKFFYYHN